MSGRPVKKILCIGAALVLPLAVVSVYFAGNWYSVFHSYSLGMVLGIFAYGYFLTALVLSARIRILDRWFGHDRVMVFHGYLASAGIFLVFCHILFKYMFSFEITGQVLAGIGAFSIFMMVGVLTYLCMTDNIISRSVFGSRSRLSGHPLLDYSRLKLIHNSVSIAAVLAVIHVFLASSTQESGIRMAVMGIWGILALGFYVYHKGVRVIALYRKKWTVSHVTQPVPGIVEIRMQGPGIRSHRAGQFAYFRMLSAVCGYAEHPFTICSAPGSEELAVTIKNLGDYTAALQDIQTGTNVLVDGPYGIFCPGTTEKPLLFIAGGIGITPFLSIIQSWQHDTVSAPVVLMWSCRRGNEMFAKEFFQDFSRRNDNFRFIPIITDPAGADEKAKRIDKPMLAQMDSPGVGAFEDIYICGPAGFMVSVFSHLKELGVGSSKIHFEKFSM